MHWFYLALAIVLEVAGTTAMKLSDGFAKTIPSVFIFVFYGLAFTALTLSLKRLDLSVVYATWGGVGMGLVAVVGFVYFNEAFNWVKLTSLVLIVVGVTGLCLARP